MTVVGDYLSAELVAAVNRPTGEASALPNSCYIDHEFFTLERDRLFARTWVSVATGAFAPERGDVRPIEFMGLPLVLVRGADGAVRVFHNVCRHRGNQLVWESCTVGASIRCPYHSWTYGLDGALKGTPHVGGHGIHSVETLDPQRAGLAEVPSAVWLDQVFVNIDGLAGPFADFIAPLDERVAGLRPGGAFDELRPAATDGTATVEFAGNWKLCVENNLESYHLPWVHPGLNAVSKLEDHYEYFSAHDGWGAFAGQGTRDYDGGAITGATFPRLWDGSVAEYPTLYPNLFFGFHNDHFWTRIVEPVRPDLTRDHLRIYYRGDAAADPALAEARAARLNAWLEVFYEDVGVVEGMQRGRHSPGFDGGIFSPARDATSHHFARWVVNQMTGGRTRRLSQ